MHEYVVADVFTRIPLHGNPVAVFTDAAAVPAAHMQRIAREMNLSETTFVLPPEEDGDVRVRIFTPVNELPFAGHPTLGTAIVLGESMSGDRIRMETAMGTIPFRLSRSARRVTSARMEQPIPTWEPYDRADELLAAVDLTSSVLPVEVYRNGPRHVYLGFGSVEELSRVKPDLRALGTHPDLATNCFAGSGTHWRTRMFSPAYGVSEDAATGSAAGPLAVHLVRHGLVPSGEDIEIVQGVEIGRPSTMYARAEVTHGRVSLVEVSGSAVVVARGALYPHPLG
jgi:trans-2,3-dihydro-3-hydroxyanthranilate isomerase